MPTNALVFSSGSGGNRKEKYAVIIDSMFQLRKAISALELLIIQIKGAPVPTDEPDSIDCSCLSSLLTIAPSEIDYQTARVENIVNEIKEHLI